MFAKRRSVLSVTAASSECSSECPAECSAIDCRETTGVGRSGGRLGNVSRAPNRKRKTAAITTQLTWPMNVMISQIVSRMANTCIENDRGGRDALASTDPCYAMARPLANLFQGLYVRDSHRNAAQPQNLGAAQRTPGSVDSAGRRRVFRSHRNAVQPQSLGSRAHPHSHQVKKTGVSKKAETPSLIVVVTSNHSENGVSRWLTYQESRGRFRYILSAGGRDGQ